MPLQHITLRPKEKKPVPAPKAEKKPALVRRLAPSPGPAILGGPSYKEQPPSPLAAGSAAITRAPLARALAPTTGRPDWQAEAWARREEILEERRVAAKGLYDKLLPLDEEGRSIALDAARRYKPDIVKAMEREGYISPDGRLAEPAKEKKVINVSQWTDETGWLNQTTVFEDGTTETEIIGRGEKEAVEGVTLEQEIALGEYGMKMTEFGERHQKEILDALGPLPKIGIDTVVENGKEIPAEPRHVNAWLEGYALLNALLTARAGEAPPEGEPTMSKAQAEFEGSSGEVKLAIQGKLGVPQTGVWDEPTEFAFSTYGDVLLAEEPTIEKEKKPSFERQKSFWDKWLKTWGKVLRVKGVNIAGETYEEWKAKKGGE